MTGGDLVDVFIGLGSNLDHPERQIRRALEGLAALPGVALAQTSPLYLSDPLGPPGQPDYVNAVAALRTDLDPLPLLDQLQAIEDQHGRERHERWGARTLDLDLLLFGQREIRHPRLTVPHPRLFERRFVLQPLADVAPELSLPDGRRIVDLLATCPPWGMKRLRQ